MERRTFLECMAWAGTGLAWSLTGGVLTSRPLAEAADDPTSSEFTFAQISDTHVGFKGEANPDALGTLDASIAKINALPARPAFVIHTGDLTHGQRAGSFDTLAEKLKAVRTERIFYVPGEHDVFLDGGKEFLERYGQGTTGKGWRSFDYRGAHFIGLVNILSFKVDGAGALGAEQLEWLERDVAGLGSSTPIVVYAHVPLWAAYPKWGWVTSDGQQALGYLRRFGSVTVLNGHIHQVLQKVEGNITFHTARSTAFPQPAPGSAPNPGPMKVPDDQVRGVLGMREVRFVRSGSPPVVVDSTLVG